MRKGSGLSRGDNNRTVVGDGPLPRQCGSAARIAPPTPQTGRPSDKLRGKAAPTAPSGWMFLPPRDGDSKAPGGSGSLAEAAQGGDEHAQQDQQRDADAADADRLEEPTGVGGQPGVGGKQEQAADQPGGRAREPAIHAVP